MKQLNLYEIGKRFGELWAVREITLGVLPSRITGLVGPNGAGKTTLFHIITGDIKPNTGEVYFNSENITGLPPWKIARKGIGKLFQDLRVFSRLTALENVVVALQEREKEQAMWGIIHPFSIQKVKKKYEEEGMKWLEFVGLAEERKKLAQELSFGQQKLLSLARLMAGRFDILLLDEPTAGVHPKMIREIEELLRKMVEEGNKTVVIIEHNMSVILDIADWVYFILEGKIAFFGKPAHVLGAREVREAYLGLQRTRVEGNNGRSRNK